MAKAKLMAWVQGVRGLCKRDKTPQNSSSQESAKTSDAKKIHTKEPRAKSPASPKLPLSTRLKVFLGIQKPPKPLTLREKATLKLESLGDCAREGKNTLEKKFLVWRATLPLKTKLAVSDSKFKMLKTLLMAFLKLALRFKKLSKKR